MQTKKNLLRKLVREEELTLDEAKTLGDTSKANFNLSFKYVIRGDKYLGLPLQKELRIIAPINSLENNLIAKLNNSNMREWDSNDPEKYLNSELNKHAQVYEYARVFGANIPKPFGLYNIYNCSKKQFSTGFVIERINGKSILQYYNPKSPDSLKFQKLEKRMIYEQGKFRKRIPTKTKFIPSDLDEKNVILEERTNKIYLIDFEDWSLI